MSPMSKTIASQLEKQQVTAGLNVTTQLIYGQTPKLCVTVTELNYTPSIVKHNKN